MRILFLLLMLGVILQRPAIAQSDNELVAARVAQFSSALGNEHPRLLLTRADLPALRAFLQILPSQPEGAALAKLAVPDVDGKPLIPEPRAVKNGTTEGNRLWREGYQAANNAGVWAQRHAFAWLLTEDPAQGREAARWLMHLASWNITRDTYRTNDELFIQHLRPMIFAYDWAYDALTPEERHTVGRALTARMEILAGFVQPKFSLTQPTPPDNSLSHPMRFVSTLGQGGLALFHEAKAAPGWLAWSYEYYLRQFPVWGGPAGGWAEGLNYWASGLTQHQRFLEGMAVLGFDEPLKRPFWRNTPYFGMYNQMPYGGSSFGDLNNIARPSGSMALILEKAATLNLDPYPLAFSRALRQKPPANFGYYTYDGIDALLGSFRTAQARLPEVNLAELPQSRYFDDIGVVAMHSALGDAANDIMLGFRSSQQGSASHAFADQNSFVLNAFGEPLAISSGYREFYGSPHHVGWSRQTKAKNALLFDGEGQRIRDATSRGRIMRFADGEHFSFVSGDALEAYAPHATQALRHIFFVGRRYFVILDEAAAPRPVQYQWRLHARSEMLLRPEAGEILQQQGKARLTVRFLLPASEGLAFSQTDAFDVPLVESYRQRMPKEWHASAQTRASTRQVEFLSLLHPWHASAATPPASHLLPATKGLALQHGQDLVLIAREAEQRVEAEGWRLDGMAASITREGGVLRFAVVEARGLDGPQLSFEASTPVSLEATGSAHTMTLRAGPGPAVRLNLKPGFAARRVQGAESSQLNADGSITLQLPAGATRSVVLSGAQ